MKFSFPYSFLAFLALASSLTPMPAAHATYDCTALLFPQQARFTLQGKPAEELFKLILEQDTGAVPHTEVTETKTLSTMVQMLTHGKVKLIRESRIEKKLMRGDKPYTSDRYYVDFNHSDMSDVVEFIYDVFKMNSKSKVLSSEHPIFSFIDGLGLIVKERSAREIFKFFESMDRLNARDGTQGTFVGYNLMRSKTRYTSDTNVTEIHDSELIFQDEGIKQVAHNTYELLMATEINKKILGSEYTYTYRIGNIEVRKVVFYDKSKAEKKEFYDVDFTRAEPKEILELAGIFSEFSFRSGKNVAEALESNISLDNTFFTRTVPWAISFMLKPQR